MPKHLCTYAGDQPIGRWEIHLAGGEVFNMKDLRQKLKVGDLMEGDGPEEGRKVVAVQPVICTHFIQGKVCGYRPGPDDRSCPWQETQLTEEEIRQQELPDVPPHPVLSRFLSGRTTIRELAEEQSDVSVTIRQTLAIMAKYDPSSDRSWSEVPAGHKVNDQGWILDPKGNVVAVLRSKMDDFNDMEQDLVKLAAMNVRLGIAVGHARGAHGIAVARKKVVKSTHVANKLRSFENHLRDGARGNVEHLVRAEVPYRDAAIEEAEALRRSSILWNFWESVQNTIDALKFRARSLRECHGETD